MSMGWSDNFRDDFLTICWIFSDDRDILVPIESHRECSWNGCRRHHEHMGKCRDFTEFLWRISEGCLEDSFTDVFCEFLSLLDTETVLFIDDDIGETFVDDVFLYERLCSDDDCELATLEGCFDRFFFFC